SKSACVLVSGGVESSVLLHEALGRYDHVTPVYVRNQLRWEEAEFFWLKTFHRMIKSARLEPIRVIEVPMRDIYERHWSITGIKVPGHASKDESMYLPGRNIIFLSKVACLAAISGIGHIEIGVLKNNPFKDSTPAFFRKIQEVLSTGLAFDLCIHAPFQKMKKEEVILLGKKHPLELTFSCVNPKGYDHCGECNKCMERKKAFFAAGVFDKTKYKKQGI
ncbi:MAG: 7-cyano-7-deazaguanine synthase, partial [Candidatus Omnitrophota bacterium]